MSPSVLVPRNHIFFCFGVFISDVDTLQGLPELAYHGLWMLCLSNQGEGNEVSVSHNLFWLSAGGARFNKGIKTQIKLER